MDENCLRFEKLYQKNMTKDITCVDDAREYLRILREDNVRSSDDVVDIYDAFIRDGNPNDLGDERWMILEQVVVAGFDTHRIDVVDICLKELSTMFDTESSLRMRRLFAMKMEMQEEFDAAMEILNSIIDEDDSNSQARKRKIAILKAQGENQKAISELVKYLKDFMADGEAWMELCDLYILEQDYAKAAFCCEELILQHPHNHLYYQRYAEIRYTQGGVEHLEMAKVYYSHAIKINPDNMRSLYGLLLTSTQLASSPKCVAQKKKEYQKSILWASNQIKKQYEAKLKQSPPPQLLEGLMGQLQLNSA